MRETYYVGFDPQLKLWEVQPIAPSYPDDFLVFRVFARHEKDALNQGLKVYADMMETPSADMLELFKHIHRQAKGAQRSGVNMVAVDVPIKQLVNAERLVDKGFFMRGYESQLLVDTRHAGWKCLEMHLGRSQQTRAQPQQEGHAMAMGF